MSYPTLFSSAVIALSIWTSSATAKHDLPRDSLHRKHHAHSKHVARFNPPAPAAGWSFLGCKGEPSGGRILANKLADTDSNSAASCTTLCGNNGYSYAGTEYGRECWCDNAVFQPTSLQDSSCSIPCSGSLPRCHIVFPTHSY